MRLRFITFMLVSTLASQQVAAGNAMLPTMDSIESHSDSMSEMTMNHQEMGVPNDETHSHSIDCCQAECTYCVISCYSMVASTILKQFPFYTPELNRKDNTEPTASSRSRLFKPPIFA